LCWVFKAVSFLEVLVNDTKKDVGVDIKQGQLSKITSQPFWQYIIDVVPGGLMRAS
jgi:hypothetical protein